ncbi:excinuclease ABC subunit UvrC [Candidatus Sulfidibacterium hydrothermale]|uniref:excinuclease ABC subunit UvrC n=1 Tax=Candidatus Sulfidibacterium hydrothermale TaxID=2875962 RepID=UPI001F0A5A78|nr:excinuclease ABC subunit UvrC [Candidatus Sulfidibacterium hydrothermale]UBM62910.1 excinuclease ABC subunit UvrC [Candidatus Sulfidibacterium hydrothermale]
MKKNTLQENLSALVRSLPEKPGVYRYYDKDGKILYVGKAKNLKKRVSSYFNKEPDSGKLRLLVKKIQDIRFIVTETELDALLLENNLIKKLQPRYNIMLKDDKTYPWICIKNEPFPRVFATRHIVNDGSEYYGPYASVRMMKTLLDIIRKLYPLRTCKLNLSPKNIQKKKFKVCLEYHLGNCMAPCVGKQSEEAYAETIAQIRSIIKGNLSEVIGALRRVMMDYAQKEDFENAQLVKEKLEILENYKSKSTIVNPRINNVDVFSVLNDEKRAYVNFLKVMNGAIVQAHTVEIKKKLNETPQEILTFAITDFRQRFGSHAKEIIVPFRPEVQWPDIKIIVPKKGDKKQLLELSERNARYYSMEQQKQQELVDPERHSRRILEKMKQDLRLDVLPEIIECFDNSNFQGTFPVASMVQFVKAKPNKKAYRHFNIKTVEGPNDFASMEEIILRRYGRLQKENLPLPQLIVVDGGKGQLSAAVKSLKKLNLDRKIAIIGIAKRLEELYFPGDPLPLYLDKKSVTLKVIQQLRDEAHRFGITHHRKRRQQGTLKSELTTIKGIGKDTAQKLLQHFRSVKKIKDVSEQEMIPVIGKAKAALVYHHFHPENKA